jgi:phosphatidate phosphatase LPIN
MYNAISDIIGVNKSLFSGSIDIIAVESENGEIHSNAFHVRFGSLKILNSKEKTIDIYVNEKKTPVKMKLSSSGDAYFMYDNNDKDLLKKTNEKFENERKKNIYFNENNNSKDNKKLLVSNCKNQLLENTEPELIEEIFLNNLINKEKFFNDPWSFIKNDNLVYYYDNNLLDSEAAMPIIFSLCVFNESIPEKKLNELKLKNNLFNSLFRTNSLKNISKIKINNLDNNNIKENLYNKIKEKKINEYTKKYKSFIPTSNQLKQLNLKKGQNKISFVYSDNLNDIQTLDSYIYLWNYNDKIIISDVDGTVTKSDVLGQILPFFGQDWTHDGTAELFSKIYENGYKMVYLSARAIGQSENTKDYLYNIFQNNKGLPAGPLLLSPDGLFSSLKREVIDRTPQILKINILTEIRRLFPENNFPFYAGFGNRNTDAIAYRAIGIELNKIFIINTKSYVVQLNNKQQKTYESIAQEVNNLFPKLD